MHHTQAKRVAVDVISRYRAYGKHPFLVGVGGSPAAGKSTLAQNLADHLTQLGLKAANCPLDGFLHTSAELSHVGLLRFKGRIDTYDVEKLRACMVLIQELSRRPFFWPTYSRTVHDPVPNGLRIESDTDILVIEGNYIFFDTDGWADVGAMLDFKIFCACDEETLRRRLIDRHLAGGRSAKEAHEKVEETDMPNAREIAKHQEKVDVVLQCNIATCSAL